MNLPHLPLFSQILSAFFVLTLLVTSASAHAESPTMQRWQFDYHGTNIPAIIWYPGNNPSAEIAAGPFTLNAATDAPLPTSPLPLVLISHGTGGSNLGHHPLAEALASEKFIVVALTHPGDNYQDRSLSGDARYFNERPNQLVAMLDALLADKQWSPLIDKSRIGAIGHSIGGYTVAAMAGARPSLKRLVKHCEAAKDDPACAYKDPSIGVSSPTANMYVLPDKVSVEISPPDRRLQSIALLAPMGSVVAPGSMKDIQAKTLIIGAEHDEILPAKYHFDWLVNQSDSAQVRVAKNSGHFSFLPPINESMRAQLGEVAIDPKGLNRSQFNQEIGQQLVQWFKQTL